ncbi:MAG: class I SAM-dependent methyltransferase [Dehalococcoidia bacterium]
MTVEPSELERWLEANTVLEHVESARAIYELMPSQSDRTLPLVYVPYDPRSEAHWSDAARIADYVAHVPEGARRVLDVGPGDGWPSLPVARALPNVEVVGVDPSPRRAEVCAANAARLELPNTRFLTADAAALPFEDGSFDAVLAANSLEEASDPAAVFAKLARALRPGGALRVSYQNWRLGTPEVETVLLWDGTLRGARVLLATYVRRVQDPPLERRYTLVLPAEGPAAAAHTEALLAAAEAPRAWGETRLRPALGVPLFERLAPHALRSTRVEMRRWTTVWLVDALSQAGFASVRATAHPGEAARHIGRDLIASGVAATLDAATFEALAAAIGRTTGTLPGTTMVEAVR